MVHRDENGGRRSAREATGGASGTRERESRGAAEQEERKWDEEGMCRGVEGSWKESGRKNERG